MNQVLEADYCIQEDFSLDKALGKRLDIYGDYDTGGPEQDDFLPIVRDLLNQRDIWSMFDTLKNLAYGFVSEQETQNPILEEDSEEKDYLEESEHLNIMYERLNIDDEPDDLLQNQYAIKKDKKDILSELQEKLKQEQEIDYEEDNIIQLPEQTSKKDKEPSLEEEVRKAA